MILRSSPSSPFSFARSGLPCRCSASMTTSKVDPADPHRRQRQRARAEKIRSARLPVLDRRRRVTFCKLAVAPRLSRRSRGRRRIVPRQAEARLAALRLQALCDGILDASILTIYETRWRRAEAHEPKWLEHQAGKVARALTALEACAAGPRCWLADVGHIPRSPACSVTAISASAAAGAATTLGSSPGSRSSPRGVPAYAVTKPTG